jgi:hypothetical protein
MINSSNEQINFLLPYKLTTTATTSSSILIPQGITVIEGKQSLITTFIENIKNVAERLGFVVTEEMQDLPLMDDEISINKNEVIIFENPDTDMYESIHNFAMKHNVRVIITVVTNFSKLEKSIKNYFLILRASLYIVLHSTTSYEIIKHRFGQEGFINVQ